MSTTMQRARARTKPEDRAKIVYAVRNTPEKFSPLVRESVQNARETAINAIGDVHDWDCHRCQRAVITHELSDPCPHCGSPDGVRRADPLLLTISRNYAQLAGE